MFERVKAMGVLRNLLHLLALIFILILPFAEPQWHPEGGWELLMGAMVPATAPIVFIIMMFDLLMLKVMRSGANADQLEIEGLISRTHLGIGGLLMFMWILSFSGVLLG